MIQTERISSLSRDPNILFDTHGLRLIIKDMGNGVRSVASADLVPIGQCLEEAALEGRLPIPFPFPDWLYDLSVAAVAGMHIDVGDLRPSVCQAVARPIDDRTIEYYGWRIPE